ncbi:hypothetical protein [Ferrovibrio sp.]|uniref:hypothetical protein n=1 Tax=Ferrovibrio sp. TaxID=1917215 RepID=UPI0026237F85|nr:hypothetical protein [Ferrovibrio sp.]
MRFLRILLLSAALLLGGALFFGTQAQDAAKPEPDGLQNQEIAVAAAKAAVAAHAEGDLREAVLAYSVALLLGLPPELVLPVEAGFCIAKLSIRINRVAIDACHAVLRHGGDSGQEHAELLGDMLGSMALLLSDESYFDETERVLREFDRRYAGLQDPDMTFDRQRIDMARAEMLRGRRQPAEAIAIINRLARERLQFPYDYPSIAKELDTLTLLRIHLFAAHDMGDLGTLKDSLHRFAKVGENLRTAEGLDYAGAIMTCQAYILAIWPDRSEPGLVEQIDLRTDGLLLFLERSFQKNRQRAMLPPASMRLVKLCGAPAYFALMPLELYRELEQQDLGIEAVRALLEDYDNSRFAEANARFETLTKGLEAVGHPRTIQMARRLALLRKYLLNAPGRRARG